MNTLSNLNIQNIIFKNQDKYEILFLVPSLDIKVIEDVYLKDLNKDDVIIIPLRYEKNKKKPSSTFIKEYFNVFITPIVSKYHIKYICVCDADYFKILAKVPKTEVNLGYVINYNNNNYIYIPSFKTIWYDPVKATKKINIGLNTLKNQLQGTYQSPGSNIIHSAYYPKSVKEIEDALNDLYKYPELTVDIETFDLKHPKAGLGSITFCWNLHEGIAFLIDPSREQRNEPVRKLLKEFFTKYTGKCIYHNIAFDVYIMIYQLFMKDLLDVQGLLEGLEVMLKNWEDTKLITYLCTNSCAGNELGLKAQAQEFAGNYAEEEIEDITKIEPGELLKYNLTDGLSTWYVYNKYKDKLKEDNQEEPYALFKKATKDIIQMQLSGLPLDMKRVSEVKQILLQDFNKALESINNSTIIKDFTKKLNEDWVEAKNKKLKVKRVSLADANIKFNPNSGTQLQKLLYSFLQLPVISFTKSKAPSVDGDTLAALKNHTKATDILELLDALLDYSAVDKILTAFIPAFENAYVASDGTGYLFGNFNLGGTVSGRLSSSKINLQQLPSTGSKYAKIIKSCFKAPKGWLFIGLDYHSLEDYISALTTKDPNKLKVYLEQYDGHCLRAYTYFKEEMPDIEMAEPEEKCYKLTLDTGEVIYIHEKEQIEYNGKNYVGKDLINLIKNSS